MASNLNRDPMRAWRQPRFPSNANPKLHSTLFSKCEVHSGRVVLGTRTVCGLCRATSCRRQRKIETPLMVLYTCSCRKDRQ